MIRPNLALAIPLAVAALASADMTWTPRNPVTGTGDFAYVTWDGQRCVAASQSGDLLVSTTCDSWTRVASPVPGIYGIAGSEDPQHPLTMLTEGHAIYRSTDGATWTQDSMATLPTGERTAGHIGLFKTAQGFGTFMGSETASYLATTIDTKTWNFTRIESPSPRTYTACSPTVTLLYNSAKMLRSSDGIHWDSSSSDSLHLGYISVVWFQNQFLATTGQGTLLTSPDGLVWTRRDDLRRLVTDQVGGFGPSDTAWANWKDAQAFGNELILVSDKNVFRTKDLVKWDKDSAMFSLALNHPLYTDKSLFSVGPKLVMANNGGALLATSDLKTWTNTIGTVTTNDLYSVASGGPRWVAVGAAGTVVHSTNGVRWNLATSGTSQNLSKVVWTGKAYKAIGDSGVFLSSADGQTWTAGSVGEFAQLRDVYWSDSIQLIVADSNRIYKSTDGTQWKVKKVLEGNELTRIASSGSKWLVTGASSIGYFSVDGISWRNISLPMDYSAVTWTGRDFVATGGYRFYRSTDGEVWTGDKSYMQDKDVHGIKVTSNGALVIVHPSQVFSAVLNDSQIVDIGNATTSGISDMALSDSLWIQVGSYGVIQTSPALKLSAGNLSRKAGLQLALTRVGDHVRFGLAKAGSVRLEAWSLRGQKLATLADGSLAVGEHAVSLSRLSHEPVYLRLSSPAGTQTLMTVP